MTWLRNEKIKKCRKSWHCSHCYSIINKGSSLVKDIGVWDGEFCCAITCMLCYNFMLSLDKHERSEYYYNEEGYLYTHPDYDDFATEWVLLNE